MLGFDPDRRVHGGAPPQAPRDRARDRAQVHARLRDAVVALVEIEWAAEVVGVGTERDAPPVPEGLRHAGADLDLLAQAGVGAPADPARDAAQRARQQHGSLVATLVAQSQSEAAARAADSPRAITSLARAKPKVEKPRTSGRIRTSHLLRCSASESHTRNDTDCTRTSTSETIESRGSSGSVTSLQISTSAPRARASCAGRFRTTPPSMTAVSASSTGENTLGSAMLARMASGRKP